MNREFIKPALIIGLTVILVGVIALIIPSWENNVLPIKKMAWFESLASKPQLAPVDSALVQSVSKLPSDLKPLNGFLDKLKDPSAKLRIAYFGDSIIEGDLLTAKLRSELQQSHGGRGVGMMPITSIVSGFRQTIKHSFSRNWESISFMTTGKHDISLGITGFTFIPRNYYVAEKTIEPLQLDSLALSDTTSLAKPEPQKKSARFYVDYDPWVEYSAANIPGGASSFSRMRLFYSHAGDSSTVRVAYNGGEKQTRRLNSGTGLQMLDLSNTAPVTKIRLTFNAHEPIHVYGISFDEASGAYVDNFPIRGYSGMYFQRIQSQYLSSFQSYLGYDLIVLQYGENVSNPKMRDYSYYQQGMVKTVKHLQAALPGVPILLVSAHDRSVKQNGAYVTSPDIPYLIQAQNRVAKETGSGFWNLFAAMGGSGSMPSFVNRKPAWAGKDYTHFTRSGADHIATMLLAYLKGD
ncbi:MAG: hypothetical protein KA984_00305 [Candidatus Cloacimonetes bacterium]|nr:hypothetical protein [Candidatus Cloacimonadota bacterium]